MSTLDFLLKYNDYINNIQKLSYDDDITIYKEQKIETLVEGLIKTHPIDKSIAILQKRFPELTIKNGKEVERDPNEILITGEIDILSKYLPLINNLGYFISLITMDGKNWVKDYSDNIKPVAMFLEPKFDIEISNIPKIMFHTSPLKFKDKINKIGFIPKTGNKLSKHPDRIYLTDNLDIAIKFGNYIKNETNEEFCIYKIDTSNISKLYSDINLRNGGYYTTQNIPKQYFTLIAISKKD